MNNYEISELPLKFDLENKAILKQASLAHRQLAELKGGRPHDTEREHSYQHADTQIASDMYSKTPFLIQIASDVHSKTAFAIHISTVMQSKTPLSLHETSVMYKKTQFPLHENGDLL